jgi:hypothetical protein
MMKMRALSIAGALALAAAAHAQTASNDIGFAIATANNQVYLGGQAEGPILPTLPYLGGGGDSFLQAYNQIGRLLWTVEFGSSAQDRVLGVAADATGVYGGGFTDGGMTGQPYFGETDAYVVKYSLTGQQLWLHEFGGPGVDRVQAAASDGTYLYVTGYTGESIYDLPFAGEQDCFAQKWDQGGNLIWTYEFGTPGTDRCYGITANKEGVFIAGRTDNVFPGQVSQGGLDAFVTRLTLEGQPAWLTQFGTSADERGWGIGADGTGLYVTGRTEGAFPGNVFLGLDDAYTAKFDYYGNMLWVNEFGTPQFDRGTAAAANSTGLYGTGYTTGALPGNVNYGGKDCYIRKWDTSGDVLWTVQFGSSQDDVCWGVATDSTGEYLAGSAGGTLPGQTAAKGFFLEKFAVNGTALWTREISVPDGGSGAVEK